jgi:acetylornithine deacetylase/succinyl-diaminopimelate desuccinylase-like protein
MESNMSFDSNIKEFISENYEGVINLLEQLCKIPAPSHHEEKRAEYCKNWLEGLGAKGVYIDESLNTVYPLNCEGSNKITVFVAHTDTVFPDLEPMPLTEDETYMYCPGVGDDTACVSVLLHLAKFCVEQNLQPEQGVLLVCNSGEEGLGNLKGTRQLFRDFAGRIKQFITFDSSLSAISDRVVGYHRYEVEVPSEGGQSWGAFSNKNALAV